MDDNRIVSRKSRRNAKHPKNPWRDQEKFLVKHMPDSCFLTQKTPVCRFPAILVDIISYLIFSSKDKTLWFHLSLVIEN
jgi:hypothetical protein